MGEFSSMYDVEHNEVAGWENDAFVSADIYNSVQAGLAVGEIVDVFSFRPPVKAMVDAAALTYPGKVSYETLHKYTSKSRPDSLQWDDGFMPQKEAARHLAAALYRAGKPVRKTDLRTLLEAQDHRFEKGHHDFAAGNGFISCLVTVGENSGLVRVVGENPNPSIELTQQGMELVRAEDMAGFHSSLSYLECAREARHQRLSDEYITILRSGNLGPFQQVRRAVYEAMEAILAEAEITGRKPAVYELILKAVTHVREMPSEELFKSPGRPYPWAKVASFIAALVNRRPVLLSDEGPVRYKFREMNKPVCSLENEWQLKLDGELILYLLDNNAPIVETELGDLSGALYNSRNEEAQKRTIEVLNLLLEEGKVVEDAGRLKPRGDGEDAVLTLEG
ncbi:hypothetical protein ACWGH8_33400 [Nonomuraea muscovyensis]